MINFFCVFVLLGDFASLFYYFRFQKNNFVTSLNLDCFATHTVHTLTNLKTIEFLNSYSVHKSQWRRQARYQRSA